MPFRSQTPLLTLRLVVIVVLGLGIALYGCAGSTATAPTASAPRAVASAAEPVEPSEDDIAGAEEHTANAQDFYDAGNYGLARIEINQALASYPQSSDAKDLQHSIDAAIVGQEAAAARAKAAEVAERAAQAKAQADANAKAAFDAKVKAAAAVDPRELASDPSRFLKKNIVLTGKALNVTQNSNYTWVQLIAAIPGRSTTQSVVVEFRPKDIKILSDECVRVWGIGDGTQKVTRTLTGASNDVPKIDGYYWDWSTSDRFGSCA